MSLTKWMHLIHFEKSKQLRLHIKWDFTDFVEKESASICCSDDPRIVFSCA